jgi:hypothetical protein
LCNSERSGKTARQRCERFPQLLKRVLKIQKHDPKKQRSDRMEAVGRDFRLKERQCRRVLRSEKSASFVAPIVSQQYTQARTLALRIAGMSRESAALSS